MYLTHTNRLDRSKSGTLYLPIGDYLILGNEQTADASPKGRGHPVSDRWIGNHDETDSIAADDPAMSDRHNYIGSLMRQAMRVRARSHSTTHFPLSRD
jgi:hypothetical protein